MSHSVQMVDLGFANARVPAGTHACQIYGDLAERDDALLRFLSCGLAGDETLACFFHNLDAQALRARLEAKGCEGAREDAGGRLTMRRAEEVYFQDGRFDPDRMIGLLTQFYGDSCASGRPSARVIGEMSPRITSIAGGSRLMEYEGRVNELLRRHPITAVCQYDARAFDGGTIMDVLTVHPMMVVRGAVIQNPFFVPPQAMEGR